MSETSSCWSAKADGNQGGGIDIYGGANNQILQNVISGNSFSGGSPTYYSAVYVANAGANGNVIAGNDIGINAAGAAALGNGGAGIYVAGGAQNTLIGANGSSSASDAAARNVISANTGEGVIIEGTSSGEHDRHHCCRQLHRHQCRGHERAGQPERRRVHRRRAARTPASESAPPTPTRQARGT